jgi:RND family efflux transporter MFP subunit
MKKYVMLFTFTVLLGASIVGYGRYVKDSIPIVEVLKVIPSTVEDSVVCTGKVEYASSGSVYAPAASISRKVYVKNGDFVYAGQKLMDVTTISTDQMDEGSSGLGEAYAAFLNQTSGSSSLPSETETKTLTSPISGRITSIAVTDAGYYIDPSKPAVEITGTAGLQLRLSVNESQISDIKPGQKAEITGAGFRNSTYYGKVKDISSEAKQLYSTTGQETVVEVVVSVDNAGDDIKPGYSAKAKITISDNNNVLVAPYESVRADNDGNEYVFRLVRNKAVKTAITTNREFSDGFEVKKGLSANDRVIENPDSISDGEFVLATAGSGASHSD